MSPIEPIVVSTSLRTHATRVVLGFALVTSILVLTLVTLVTAARPAFFGSNLVTHAERNLLVLLPLAAAAAAVGFGVWLVRKAPELSVPALSWWVRVACPVLILPVLLALLSQGFAGETETALVLALAVIALERLLRVSLAAWAERPAPSSPAKTPLKTFFEHPRAPFIAVLALTAAQATLIGLWSVWSHQRFSTYGFDLGQYDSVFACTLHGRWLAMPPLGYGQNFGDVVNNHADFGTLFLLPIYALYPDAKTLLVIQAVMVAGAAVPLFLFAKKRLSTGAGFALAVAWLAYAPMHAAQLYDFHWQLIAASLVICALAALEYGRMKTWWVFFGLAIICREDVSIGLTALGLYLVLSGERPKLGLITVVVSGAFFALLRFAVMRNQSFANIHYSGMQAPGEGSGFGAVIKTLISNPAFSLRSVVTWEKARYFAQIFAPLAFLPLRRPWLWLLMIPGIVLTLLTNGPLPPIQINFQYVGNWAGYMFPAAAIALAAFGDDVVRRRAALTAMLVATLVAAVQWGAYSPRGVIRGGFFDVPLKPPEEIDRARERDLLELLAQVPDDVVLCTSERVQPHTTALHLENVTLRSGVTGCEYLLWSNLADPGAENAITAINSGTFEAVERRPSGISLARRKR